MDKLFTWEVIGTLAGASAIAYLIVSYTKRAIDTFWPKWLGTDIYAVLISFLILLAATGFNSGKLTWSNVVLALFNAFLVAATAGKMNDKAKEAKK